MLILGKGNSKGNWFQYVRWIYGRVNHNEGLIGMLGIFTLSMFGKLLVHLYYLDCMAISHNWFTWSTYVNGMR